MYIRIETRCDVMRSPDDFNDLIRTVATVIGCPVENVKVVFFPGVNMTQGEADPWNGPRVQVTCIYDKGETASNNEKLKTMIGPALRFLLPENHQNPRLPNSGNRNVWRARRAAARRRSLCAQESELQNLSDSNGFEHIWRSAAA